MRKLIYILILSGLPLLVLAQGKNITVHSKWVVQANSSLNIEGSTNINSFRCDVTEYMKPDTLVCRKDLASKKILFNNSYLSVDIGRFDCHHRFITSDFRKTLKADEHPVLKIYFLSLDNLDAGSNYVQNVKGEVNIELAGVTRKKELLFDVAVLPDGKLELSGNRILTFGEFGMKPPRKLAGLIRIEEEIKVNFRLYLKTL